MFDPKNLKKDFPIFKHHPKLVYLDSTATTLKPQVVIDAERKYYEEVGATVHRGVYDLSVKATDMYEGAREKIRKFINAKSTKEIIFTRNATEAINLVSNTLSQTLPKVSVILTTEMEHHSNIVPWLPPLHPFPRKTRDRLFRKEGAAPPTPPLRGGHSLESHLKWIPVGENGMLDLTNLDELLKGVKLLTVTQMSNVLGTVNNVTLLGKRVHQAGGMILVDGAQSVPHMPVDVQDLDCDFFVFSGHKMLGPTGIGVLYAKEEILKDLPPFLRGGDMILEVTKDSATWNELPWKFEAGTPNIAGAIGLGAAVDYLQQLGMENVWQHEQELAQYGLEQLSQIGGVRLLGARIPSPSPMDSPLPNSEGGGDPELVEGERGKGRAAIFAFTIDGIHPHDIGSILNDQEIAVRAGHHCAMVLHQKFGLTASARASCYVYNTRKDIDALVDGIRKVQEVFR